MDPEEYLRDVVQQRLIQFQNAPERVQSEIHSATFSYLAGAVEVLAKLDLLPRERGFALAHELLRPMTDPLVDSGALTPVTARAEASVKMTAHYDPRRGYLQAVAHLREIDILTEDESSSIRRRIEERFPLDNDHG